MPRLDISLEIKDGKVIVNKGFLEPLADPNAPYGFFYRCDNKLWDEDQRGDYFDVDHCKGQCHAITLTISAQTSPLSLSCTNSLFSHSNLSSSHTNPHLSGVERISYSLPERTIQVVATVAFAVAHAAAFSYLYTMQPSLAAAALASWLMNSLSLARWAGLIALAMVDKVRTGTVAGAESVHSAAVPSIRLSKF